jgi:hypothetical protein
MPVSPARTMAAAGQRTTASSSVGAPRDGQRGGQRRTGLAVAAEAAGQRGAQQTARADGSEHVAVALRT